MKTIGHFFFKTALCFSLLRFSRLQMRRILRGLGGCGSSLRWGVECQGSEGHLVPRLYPGDLRSLKQFTFSEQDILRVLFQASAWRTKGYLQAAVSSCPWLGSGYHVPSPSKIRMRDLYTVQSRGNEYLHIITLAAFPPPASPFPKSH